MWRVAGLDTADLPGRDQPDLILRAIATGICRQRLRATSSQAAINGSRAEHMSPRLGSAQDMKYERTALPRRDLSTVRTFRLEVHGEDCLDQVDRA